MPNLTHIASGMLVLACVLQPLGADAQTFPNRPIRLIVPTAPGPGVDLVGRQIGQKLTEDLGQPVMVENRPGASGIIGAEHVVRSPADGHTILLATPSMVVTVVYLMKSLPFDPVKDLAPITAAVEPATAIVVNPSVAANNVKELIDWVKGNPGKVSYGSAGVGSVFHMVGELFNQAAGTDMTHVPYKSVPPSVAGVMAGEVQVTYSAMTSVLPHQRAGKLRILAVLERDRFPRLPDIPTVGETLSGFEKPPSWFGFFAPSATPQAVVRRLNAGIVKALNAPDLRNAFEEQALTVIGNTPEQFAAMIRSSFQVYEKAIKVARLKPE